MSAALRPALACPKAPYWLSPTPCPFPAPVRTNVGSPAPAGVPPVGEEPPPGGGRSIAPAPVDTTSAANAIVTTVRGRGRRENLKALVPGGHRTALRNTHGTRRL